MNKDLWYGESFKRIDSDHSLDEILDCIAELRSMLKIWKGKLAFLD